MSMVLDGGKFHFRSLLQNNNNQKNKNNRNNINKNHQKNLNLKNNNILNTDSITLPNNKNLSPTHKNKIKLLRPKKANDKLNKLKHNKSFEENYSVPKDIFATNNKNDLQTQSLIINEDNETNYKNKKNIKSNFLNYMNKKVVKYPYNSKKLNNSYFIPKKINSSFDERIFSSRNNYNNISNKKLITKENANKKINKISLANHAVSLDLIDNEENLINNDEIILNTNEKNFVTNDNNEDLLLIKNLNNDSLIEDDNLLNNSFENSKNDFYLLYPENYEKAIKNNMLKMEIQLMVEKIFEIQNKYHAEYNKLKNKFIEIKNLLKLLYEKSSAQSKYRWNIKKFNAIPKNFKKSEKIDILKIHKEEIFLWNKMFGISKKENSNNKEILKSLFKNIVFEKYKKIYGKLNNIEIQIIENLMRKYRCDDIYEAKTSKIISGNMSIKNNINGNGNNNNGKQKNGNIHFKCASLNSNSNRENNSSNSVKKNNKYNKNTAKSKQTKYNKYKIH